VKANADEIAWMLYQQFVDRFRPTSDAAAASPSTHRVLPGEISEAEKALDACFPASITQFWLKQGYGPMPLVAPATAIFPRPADCPPPFARILSPADVVAETQTPRYAAIPDWVHYDEDDYRGADIERDDAWKYILPIAVDARGRFVCMLRHYNIEVDLPIYRFDHASGEIAGVANGFDDLLRAYLRLPVPR
jgi:hypothetical protein